MAYKFQLGSARLSGSTTFEQPLVVEDSFSATSLSASAGLQVGGTVELDGVIDVDAAPASDSFYILDATDGLMKRESMSEYATTIAGDGLAAASGVLKVDVSDFAGAGLEDDGSENLRISTAAAGLGISGGGGSALAVDLNQLSAADVAVSADSIAIIDATDNTTKKESIADLVSGLAGVGLSASGGVMSIDIDEFSELAEAPHATQDEFLVSDNGNEKRVSMTNVAKGVFALVTGGDATIAGNGALTIAADSVQGSMLNTDAADGTTMELSSDSLSVLKVPNALSQGDGIAAFSYDGSGALTVALSASVAGSGLSYSSGVVSLDIDELGALGGVGLHQTQDFFPFSDNGTEKKISFSNLQDAVFADVSGDATIAAGGALTIGAGAVEHGMLADDIISGQAELAHADINDDDHMMIDDAGVVKKVGVDSLRDHFFGVVSGDATVADGGALTIAAGAVEGSMLNANVPGLGLHLSGSKLHLSASVAGAGLDYAAGVLKVNIDEFDALGSAALHQTQDKFLFSDNGVEKTVTFSNLQDAVFADVSGDATIAAGGALTIAADSVEGTMLNTNAADGTTMELSSNSLSVLKVPNAITVDNATLQLDSGTTYDGAAGRTISIKDGGVDADALNASVAGVGLSGGGGSALGVDLNGLSAGVVDVVNDSIAIIDATDNVSKKESIQDFVGQLPAVGGGISASGGKLTLADTVTALGDANASLAFGINVQTSLMSAARKHTLPAPVAGRKLVVKGLNTGTYNMTIEVDDTSESGTRIDGSQTSIVIESDAGAVTLLCTSANRWIIV